jgi:hypothetical protein
VIHFIVKSGAGWFPKKPKNKRKVSIYDHPKVPKREGPPKQYQSPAPVYMKVYKEVDKKELNNTTATGLGVFQTLVEINGRPTMALVDTGASASFISEELVEVLGIAT